jgi:hypothetical protein
VNTVWLYVAFALLALGLVLGMGQRRFTSLRGLIAFVFLLSAVGLLIFGVVGVI